MFGVTGTRHIQRKHAVTLSASVETIKASLRSEQGLALSKHNAWPYAHPTLRTIQSDVTRSSPLPGPSRAIATNWMARALVVL